MKTLHVSSLSLSLSLDLPAGQVASLMLGGQERLAAPSPLFRVRLRESDGRAAVVTSREACACAETEDGAIYTDFPDLPLSVRVRLTEEAGEAAWYITVTPGSDRLMVEWVDFPLVTLPALSENNPRGNGGQLLFPYNEGVLISDLTAREETGLRHMEPEYPSLGSYAVFPNMICSQMLAYLWEDAGLYVGAHDPTRGVKGIDFFGDEKGVTLQLRLFCGVEYGQTFQTDYPIVWAATNGRWEAAAERYRAWFESALPPRAVRIRENPSLPAWYEESPLVISYPIRGRFDMDEMIPNALYPYTNALPLLDELRQATGSALLVLLMHWEGTAPWAPPYVWPPYGDMDNFQAFRSALREKGDRLGVYCSGFGYTIQSNLLPDYDRRQDYERDDLAQGMCAGPDGQVQISKICQGQRSGYDICPASDKGRALLDEAYRPLFQSDLDYVQILDQNHGGGQYFCYSRTHGHPPAPGPWMTERMQRMLSDWNEQAPHTLFGCESAASEPFIGNLLFSDNRFELNYRLGQPVPLYAYLYHEYVRNFMGNQVSCPFRPDEDTLRYRIAYAFAAGDCMTVVLSPEGNFLAHWGVRDFTQYPNREKAVTLLSNLTRFYREQAKPYLYGGRMLPARPVTCDTVTFGRRDSARTVTLPALLTTAWEAEDGSRAQLLVNPSDSAVICRLGGSSVTVPPLDAILCPLS